ncbi:hypothetical protein pb186bvf_006925 [Paramecium bursaria]
MSIELEEILNGTDSNRRFTDFFEFREILGKGAFGVVVQALNLTTEEEVAVKIINKNIKDLEFDQLRKEASILSQLRHKNIVKFLDVKETDTKILIVMELVQGGSLASLMNRKLKSKTWFTETQCKSLMEQLLDALAYIHQQNIVHRDLKPENILIDESSLQVKITDFGLSTGFRSDETFMLQQQCGTMVYMAPEQLEGRVYNKAVDIWSLGVIMYQLLKSGLHPYYKSGHKLDEMKESIRTLHENTKSQLTQDQFSLFSRLTNLEPRNRYIANQALLHPWIDPQCKDVPMVMSEMVRSFQLKDKFPQYIKVLFMMIKFGYNKQLTHIDKCNQFQSIHQNEIQEVHKKEGKTQGIAQEFYDDLFQKYQYQLNGHQLDSRKQSQDSLTNQQRQGQHLQEKFQFIIKTKKIPSQPREDDEKTYEKLTPIQSPQFQSDEDIPEFDQKFISTENKTQQNYASPIVKKKLKSPKAQKKLKNLTFHRAESYTLQEEQLENQQKIQSQSTSPTKQKANNSYLQSKFKIQLKPLNSPINEQVQAPPPPPPMIPENRLQPIQSVQIQKPLIQPRQIQRQRQANFSVVENVKVVPANVLDIGQMGLGDISPVNNNQLLFPSRRNNSLQQTTAYKRMYPNEFHPSKVLTQPKRPDNQFGMYNFINGGPK